MLYVVSIIFIIGGLIFKAFPPKKINSVYGHRTSFSMKNQDTWDEAQRYSAISLITLGFTLLIIAFILNALAKNISETFQGIILLIGALIMLFFDEIHLRKVFNNDGTRK
ncbi:SdpI family protein [Clostridium sp. 'White wine YQ']|uniref:SdpI family protein n=1 Tax=Clostridium sp. 'White wine YQ' TaxID=3027474 RepID=UPI002366432C|nr:SdpI family protein [Clostridium sp. 'White wine YQ']MDD7794467.1 SdpI family protein [Clostridium sp. 'White wine YQ']